MNDAEVYYELYGEMIVFVPFYKERFVRISDE